MENKQRQLTPEEEKEYFQYWRSKITGPEKEEASRLFIKELNRIERENS